MSKQKAETFLLVKQQQMFPGSIKETRHISTSTNSVVNQVEYDIYLGGELSQDGQVSLESWHTSSMCASVCWVSTSRRDCISVRIVNWCNLHRLRREANQQRLSNHPLADVHRCPFDHRQCFSFCSLFLLFCFLLLLFWSSFVSWLPPWWTNWRRRWRRWVLVEFLDNEVETLFVDEAEQGGW